jgi:hypothetical protein
MKATEEWDSNRLHLLKVSATGIAAAATVTAKADILQERLISR